MPHSVTPQDAATMLPPPPARLFLVGIGGIGMSGLAQLLRWLGYTVAGSDRQLDGPGRDDLIGKLRALGIGVWPQDGSGVRQYRPDVLIYSSAVEPSNPDLAAGAGRPFLQRAVALAGALNGIPGARQIAVAGSCGKSTVTAWLASALRALGEPVLVVCGALVSEFEGEDRPGNFHADPEPHWLVYEVDESDGSLVSFTPDFGAVLNIGTDHHDRPKLVGLFSTFAGRCRHGVVVQESLRAELVLPPDLPVVRFADAWTAATPADTLAPEVIQCGVDGIRFTLGGMGTFAACQHGYHSAANAVATLALLRLLGWQDGHSPWAEAIAGFQGVRQRFEYVGRTALGVPVYNDYAHNVEKIGAALRTAQEISRGPALVVFQPHGYGPFGFMREPLKTVLGSALRPGDEFILLPVYYGGGSSSFKPTAAEVADDYRRAGLPVVAVDGREAALARLGETADRAGVVVVMGARDPSLPAWARSLVVPPAGFSGARPSAGVPRRPVLRLSVAYSPCPNDTFMFHELATGRVVVPGCAIDVHLHDVETLNRKAFAGTYDVTKLSFYAWLLLRDRYELLRTGAALGFGCGPLLIAARKLSREDLPYCRVAVPGEHTTAGLLLRLYAPDAKDIVFTTYDRVFDLLRRGDAAAGVIVHESRFTFEKMGFLRVVDLGAWWEGETSLPVPLGCVASRQALPASFRRQFETALSEAIRRSRAAPADALRYAAAHAAEIEPEVLRKHIDTYVTDFSLDLGDLGHAAVTELERRARRVGIIA